MSLPGRAKRKREPIYLRVTPQGTFEPASDYYRQMLRAKGYRVGDVVRAELTKPRHPRHHRLVMALLQKVLDNAQGLMTMDQLLTVVKIKMGRAVPFTDSATLKVYWVPESIAFDSMDQAEFETFWADLCTLVARDYFPHLTREQVAELAEMMD